MFDQLLYLSRVPQKAQKKTSPIVANRGADVILDNADEDAPDNRLALYQEQVVAIEALNYFTEWCETKEDELEDGEGFGDRLLGLMVAVADDNQDGELDDFDNDLARNIHQFILGKLPQGEDEMQDEMDALIFSTEENEPMLDSAISMEIITDAAYRKVFAIRNGKKLRINKRISGKVRLSAKQRQAIRKAQRRANTGAAKMRRLKSFRMRRRAGL